MATITVAVDRHRPNLIEASAGPYARVPPCHKHTDYAPGCPTCRRYQAWSARRQRLSIQLGQPLSHDISEVREHLRALQRGGMLLADIAEASGVNKSTISGILYQANRQAVCRHNALRILAIPVPAGRHRPPTTNLIPAVGTIRRTQALARLGWTFAHIIAAGGSTIHRLDQVMGQRWVTVRFAAAVDSAYEVLSMRQGPSANTAARAAKKGWPPPLAWDDDDLDDPDAVPNLGGVDTDVDEVLVNRALTGHAPIDVLNEAEQAALWRAWTAHRAEHGLDGPGLRDFARTHHTTVLIAERCRNLADGVNSRGNPTTSSAAVGRANERTAA